MGDVTTVPCFWCLSRIPLRIILGVLFLLSIVSFLPLNYYMYGNDRNDNTIHRLQAVKEIFLARLWKAKGSLSLEADNQTVDTNFASNLFISEQLLTKKLPAAKLKCEELLSKLAGNASKTTTGHSEHKLPQWQQRLTTCKANRKAQFYLTCALQVRIYTSDRAKWTIKELKQWLHYLFWAGVEHVYVCDHYRFQSERLDVALGRYVDADLVTYIPWNAIRTPMTAQVACYQHIIDDFGQGSLWQIAVDIDEYPFVPKDTAENFLVRYLQTVSLSTSEVSLHNYLMLGQGDRTRTMAIERITQMTPKPANQLDKPVYRPTRVVAELHHNRIKYGHRKEAVDGEIRLLHYWGARLSHFGPDNPDLLFKTIKYTLLRDTLAGVVRRSLISFGELDSFSNDTGP